MMNSLTHLTLEGITGELITLGPSVFVHSPISWLQALAIYKFKSRHIFSFLLFKCQYIMHLPCSRDSVWYWLLRDEGLRVHCFMEFTIYKQPHCINTMSGLCMPTNCLQSNIIARQNFLIALKEEDAHP